MTDQYYTVAGHGTFTFNGTDYTAGHALTMDENAAARLVAKGRLVPADRDPAPAPRTGQASVTKTDKKTGTETMLLGSSVLPAEIEIGPGATVTLGDLVVLVHERSGLSVADWNDEPDEVRDQMLAGGVRLLKAVLEAPSKDGDKPNVKDVEALLKADISAADRDAAWAVLQLSTASE